MAKKHTRCSSSLGIREIQIKTMMRLLLPCKNNKIKNKIITISNAHKDVEKLDLSLSMAMYHGTATLENNTMVRYIQSIKCYSAIKRTNNLYHKGIMMNTKQ